jgi:hypothetical protein
MPEREPGIIPPKPDRNPNHESGREGTGYRPSGDPRNNPFRDTLIKGSGNVIRRSSRFPR